MFDVTKALALTLTLGFAGGAMAQETTPAPAEGQTTGDQAAESQPAAPAEQAPAAEAKVDGPGSIYVKATHGDWEERCMRGAEGQPDLCQIYQLLKDGESNSVAEIGLFPLPPGEKAVAGATITAPLETLLTDGLTLQVDGGKGKVYPFSWCDRGGCVARLGFTADEISAFKKGNKATLTIVPVAAPDQKVTVAISLAGFTAGFDALPPPAGQ
ncbi:MAG: invasion associated locus B family protein [Gemmobacter sp.]|nr:invasion associated locus B family protein [Gemmobacter sp.]